jgi:hypothetical protein
MQYVPSIPPPIKELERNIELKGLSASKPVKPVGPRTMPPFISLGLHRPTPSERAVAEEERMNEQRITEERRKYCRRIDQQWTLIDLRTPNDRRHHKQRQTDLTTSVDEEA